MKIEKGKISNFQLLILIMGFIQGSALLVGFTDPITKHDTWLVVLASMAVIAPFAYCYAALAKRFAGLNLIQINHIVYGPLIGTLISFYYLYFFMITLSLNLRDIGTFYSTFLMTDTPQVFFVVMFALVCAFAITNGIEVLARVSLFFVVTGTLIIVSTFVLLFGDMNFSHFLPIFKMSAKEFVHGTHIISSIPFGEMVIFLMVMAYVDDTSITVRNTLLGFLLGAVSLLSVAVRNTAVLGPTQAILTSSPFQATRLIDVGGVLTRMDILVAIGQTILLFLKCSIFFYGTVVALAQLLRLRSYVPLIIPVAIIESIFALIIYRSAAEHAAATINYAIIYLIPPMYLFPVLTLLIAHSKNLPRTYASDEGELQKSHRELRALICRARRVKALLEKMQAKLKWK